jgi:hypothetical protein
MSIKQAENQRQQQEKPCDSGGAGTSNDQNAIKQKLKQEPQVPQRDQKQEPHGPQEDQNLDPQVPQGKRKQESRGPQGEQKQKPQGLQGEQKLESHGPHEEQKQESQGLQREQNPEPQSVQIEQKHEPQSPQEEQNQMPMQQPQELHKQQVVAVASAEHQADNLYKCKECNSSWKISESLLKAHMHYVHGYQRKKLPYKCKECTNCFIKESNLKQHMMVHRVREGSSSRGATHQCLRITLQ